MHKLHLCIVCSTCNVCMTGVRSRGIGHSVNVNAASPGNLGSIILAGSYSCTPRCMIKVITRWFDRVNSTTVKLNKEDQSTNYFDGKKSFQKWFINFYSDAKSNYRHEHVIPCIWYGIKVCDRVFDEIFFQRYDQFVL